MQNLFSHTYLFKQIAEHDVKGNRGTLLNDTKITHSLWGNGRLFHAQLVES